MTTRKSHTVTASSAPFTALAVADHESGIRGLQTALKEAGVVHAELTTIRPRQAQEMLAKGSYDLVVLRDAPPECDAMELLNEAHGMQAVVVAAHDDWSRVIELFEAGAYDVVSRQQMSCGLLPYILRRSLGEPHPQSTEPTPQFEDESLRKALQNSPVTVWRQDRNLRYTWIFNPAPPIADPQEIIGRTDEELFGAEGAKELIELKQQALKSGEPVHDEIRLVANKRVTHHNVTIEPLRNEQGQFTGLLCTSVNVTASHRTEEELRDAHDDLVAANERLRREMRRRREISDLLRDQVELLDLAQDAIFVCDSEDRILYWNRGAEYTYGYAAGEAVGHIAYELLHTQFPDSFEVLKDRLLREGSLSGELQQIRKDGKQITVAGRWTVRRSGDDEVSFLQINRDITGRKLMENALRVNETRLALAQQAGRVGSFDWDLVSGESVWTEQLEALYGLAAGEGGTDVGFLHIHVDDRVRVSKRLRHALARHRKVISGDFRMVRHDGQIRWLANRGMITYDESGNPLRMIGTSVDVTERKRAEETMRQAMAVTEQQRAQLEAVFHSVEDGIVVTDMQGNVLLVNEAEARINSYPSTEAMKRDLAYFAKVYEIRHPGGKPVPVDQWPLSRVMRGESVSNWELKARRRDTGREWDFSFSGEPVCDENGKQTLAVVVTRDITERKEAEVALAERAETLKRLNSDLEEMNAQLEEEIRDRTRAEEALRQSEEHFRAIFEEATIGIILEDTHGHIIDANPAIQRLLGWSIDEMRNLGVAGITHQKDSRTSMKLLAEMESGARRRQSVEKRYVCKDGGSIWGSVTLFGICDARERLQYVSAMIEDITLRKQAEDQLHRHNEELERLVAERTAQIRMLERQRLESEKQVSVGRMAARIAHEINNPLAGVKNSFLLVKKAIPPDFKHYEFVARIERELDRIARIVRQMFELYRPERHEPDIFKPADAVQDVIVLLEGNIRAQGVTIESDTTEAGRSVKMHGDSLKQVLFNVLQNAIEASPMGAVVHVAASLSGNMLEVAVRDEGRGIPEEMQSKIFEPFFTTKGDSATGGLGLGLSTTRSLLGSMDGSISLESEVNKGTTFHITLPVQPVENS